MVFGEKRAVLFGLPFELNKLDPRFNVIYDSGVKAVDFIEIIDYKQIFFAVFFSIKNSCIFLTFKTSARINGLFKTVAHQEKIEKISNFVLF